MPQKKACLKTTAHHILWVCLRKIQQQRWQRCAPQCGVHIEKSLWVCTHKRALLPPGFSFNLSLKGGGGAVIF